MRALLLGLACSIGWHHYADVVPPGRPGDPPGWTRDVASAEPVRACTRCGRRA